jgi:hypothetical protein
MLTIDKLRLSLPAGYEPRAGRIARLIADELATLPLQENASQENVSIARLQLPALHVAHGASDRHVAGAIASAIAAQVNRSNGGGTQ